MVTMLNKLSRSQGIGRLTSSKGKHTTNFDDDELDRFCALGEVLGIKLGTKDDLKQKLERMSEKKVIPRIVFH